MKIYIDFSKEVITKVDNSVAYVGDVFSNTFEVLFYNYGADLDWFPTMSQLAPNGRSAGDFSADALEEDESHTYTEDGVTYQKFTFTIGDAWVKMKGRSNFYIWVNRVTGLIRRKCVGKVNVMLNESTENFVIQDPYFNPNVKAYIDNEIEADMEEYGETVNASIEAQNETIDNLLGGTPQVFDTASNIGNLQENKGIAVATDTGYIYVWNGTGYSNTNVKYLVDVNYEELVQDLEKANIVNDTIDFDNKVDGYFINNAGGLQQASGWAYLPNITIKKGQTVIFVASGFKTGIAMISRQNSASSFTQLVASINSSEQTYTYSATEDMFIALCFNSSVSYRAYFVNYVVDTQALKDTIDNSNLYEEIDFTNQVNGYFINYQGSVQSATGWAYLTNISLKKGQKLTVIGSGFSTNVAMISKQVDNTYLPFVVSIDSTQRTYTYLAKYDMTFAISYNSSAIIKAYKTYNLKDLIEDNSKKNCMCIFPRLAVVGDSLSSGNLTVNSQWEDVYGDSWLSYIARKNNAVARTHYSNAGATTKSCLENYLTKIQTDTPFNAYFIALGTNDIGKISYDIPTGTIDDTSSDTTFVGYYKKLIEEITTHAPNCAIFCVSLYRVGGMQNYYSNLIKQISELYSNCFYIELVKYLNYYDNSTSVYNENGHYSTLGYNYVANIINDLVNEVVANNTSFFKMFGKYNSVGTKYED